MKILPIKSDFRPSHNQLFFLDTNVWLYLYYPQGSRRAQKEIATYSDFFGKIASEPIQTNLVQMSELINTIMRAEYRVYSESVNRVSFKDFRSSDSGKDAMKISKDIATAILKIAELRDGIFSPEELKSMVNDCDKADFNDIYFAYYCRKLSFTLVTHDFDFAGIEMDINLLTGNSRYF